MSQCVHFCTWGGKLEFKGSFCKITHRRASVSPVLTFPTAYVSVLAYSRSCLARSLCIYCKSGPHSYWTMRVTYVTVQMRSSETNLPYDCSPIHLERLSWCLYVWKCSKSLMTKFKLDHARNFCPMFHDPKCLVSSIFFIVLKQKVKCFLATVSLWSFCVVLGPTDFSIYRNTEW